MLDRTNESETCITISEPKSGPGTKKAYKHNFKILLFKEK